MTGDVYQQLGAWMASQREKIGLSEALLADMLEISPVTVRKIERGRVKVLLHVYQNIRDLLDDDNLAKTAERARLFFKEPLKRPRRRFISAEQYHMMGAQIKELYEGGMSIRALSKRYQIGEYAVRQSLKAVGIDDCRRPNQ